MRHWIRGTRAAALALSLLATTGCAGMSLESVLGGMGGMGGMGGSTLEGEIRYVDQRNREIELRGGGAFGGSTRVRYDSGTSVYYRSQRYSVGALEPGDLVEVRVDRDRRGDPYAREIHVQRSARDGGYGGGGYEDYPSQGVRTLEGRVGWIDFQRGRFELEAGGYGRPYVVSLPYNPGSGTLDRFRRLRRGDRVRIEGELLGQERVELVRFR